MMICCFGIPGNNDLINESVIDVPSVLRRENDFHQVPSRQRLSRLPHRPRANHRQVTRGGSFHTCSVCYVTWHIKNGGVQRVAAVKRREP